MRKITVEVSGFYSNYPSCLEDHCHLHLKCSNYQHSSDIKQMRGMTPFIVRKDSEWFCEQKQGPNNGAMLLQGKRRPLVAFADVGEDW